MENKKIIIFDSSAIISFALIGFLDILTDLKHLFKGKFVIPWAVKKEIIDNPIKTKRFELEALKIKTLLDGGVFEMPESLGISKQEIEKKANELLDISNNLFIAREKSIHIIDRGESECLALSKICEQKGIENILIVDERTTRMLCENIENLKKLFEKKLHTKIDLKKNTVLFSTVKCVRSAELLFIAYKKQIVKLKNGNVLNALLYAVKFKGCSISDKEISDITNLKTNNL